MAVKILNRKPLTFWERTYLPLIFGGLRLAMRNLWRPATTLEYPDQRPVLPRNYRGAPTLVRDPNGREKCVACQLCEFACPAGAIRITPGEIPKDSPNAHIEKEPAKFDLNLLRCVYCGLCQEVCPEDAIHLQQHYSTVGVTRREFVHGKAQLYAAGGTLPNKSQKQDKA